MSAQLDLNNDEILRLESLALRVREHIVRMATNGGCFIGASLSCADLLVYMYNHVLNVNPETIHDTDRDYLLLSKGHDVPALYSTLAERGFFSPARLSNHLSVRDHFYWHPNTAIPGIEFHSGSLGHLLSVGIGIAMDIKMRSGANRVFVVLGDGELNEGSIWEALLVAHAKELDNLVAVVDRNRFQANMRTEELIPIEPLSAKFSAFGWHIAEADGHSFRDLHRAFSAIPDNTGQPAAIIARTVRGKGLPSIEERADRWFVNFSAEEIDSLVDELYGSSKAHLKSLPMTVR